MNELVDGPVTVHVGDVLQVLRQLPSGSVHCVCTSPPYFGLRSYGTPPRVWGGDAECDHEWRDTTYADTRKNDDTAGPKQRSNGGSEGWRNAPRQNATCERCGAWCGELGLEPTPQLYVSHLVDVFEEVRRVLRRDGSLWLVIGDSFAGSWGAQSRRETPRTISRNQIDNHPKRSSQTGTIRQAGLKPKDLIGIPWMTAFALRDAGWWLRQEITWAKRAPMPESVEDRPVSATEKVFLLTKSQRYFYDHVAVQEAATWGQPNSPGSIASPYGQGFTRRSNSFNRNGHRLGHGEGSDEKYVATESSTRNMRNYWLLGPEPYPAAHFATYPSAIPVKAIAAGSSEHGVCAECGAPWERVVELVGGRTTGRTAAQAALAASRGITGARYTSDHIGDHVADRRTLGWQPTCAHNREPVPATILDLFAGSGTTLSVARRMGRRAIGIELQANYLPLIQKRIAAGALPLLELLTAGEP